MGFDERLWIQDKILNDAERLWAGGSDRFITDRTPIDMAAYTLADIQGITAVDADALASYVNRCFSSANKYFDRLILVQPGIPIIDAPGKAAPNKAYMEHLNSMMIGLLHDERQLCPVTIIGRAVINLDERLNLI